MLPEVVVNAHRPVFIRHWNKVVRTTIENPVSYLLVSALLFSLEVSAQENRVADFVPGDVLVKLRGSSGNLPTSM